MPGIVLSHGCAGISPFHRVKHVPETVASLFIVAGNEELFNDMDHAYSVVGVLKGPSKVIEIPGITHFEMYIGENFEQGSNAAVDWFRKYLGLDGTEYYSRQTEQVR